MTPDTVNARPRDPDPRSAPADRRQRRRLCSLLSAICLLLCAVCFLGVSGAWDVLRVYRSGNEVAQDAAFTGNVSLSGANVTYGAISATTVTASGNVTAADVTASGTASGATVTSSGAVNGVSGNFSGTVAAGGNVTAVDVTASGTVKGATGNFTGELYVGGNVTATGTVSGTINASTLLGSTWASPAAIGTGTPANGTFADLAGKYKFSAHTATGNITAAECTGLIVTNTGAGGAIELTLPAATVGASVLVYLTAAFDVDVTPAAGETIGILTNSSDDTISSDATPGTFVVLVCETAGTWLPLGYTGTWTDAD